jgi:hypothetical protein
VGGEEPLPRPPVVPSPSTERGEASVPTTETLRQAQGDTVAGTG